MNPDNLKPCPDCQDTGWIGDQGPGGLYRNGKRTHNDEVAPCGCNAADRAARSLAPEAGTIFRNGDLGDCKVVKVWKSRSGNWIVSFSHERGGGGRIYLSDYAKEFANHPLTKAPTK